MSDLLPWLVISPETGTVIPIVDGQGPMEYGCDVVHVEAETREDALYLGVMLLRQMGADYLSNCENPYAGVKVESAICPKHGPPTWNKDYYQCLSCDAEWEAAYRRGEIT